MPFYGRVRAKTDPFWQHNQPGTLWNCKCDWEETDDPVTAGNPQKNIEVPGLKGNPATTSKIFSDDAPYIARAAEGTDVVVKQSIREIYRAEHETDNITFHTSIGNIVSDNITAIEISKGAKTDASYFCKLEIAQNITKYINQMTLVDPSEPIDLSHNNHRSIFYQRKKLFLHMKVYTLNIHGYDFQIKFGEYSDGTLNLYAITEP